MMGANPDPRFNKGVTLQSQNRPTLTVVHINLEPDPSNLSRLCPMSLLPGPLVAMHFLSRILIFQLFPPLFQKTFEKRFHLHVIG